jgi:hypothetical protein
MWMYRGPSCPDCPFSEELGDAEINTCIHRVLAHGVILNPRAGPTPLREGVDGTRVSLFAFTFGNLRNLICLWHLCMPAGPCVFSQCTTGEGVTLYEDAVRREANRALNELLRERRQRWQAWSVARMAVWARGQDTPSEPESSEEDEEDEEEGEVIPLPPPHSPLCEALPSLDDIFHRQVGIAVDARLPKQTRTETEPSTGSPP